MSKIRLYIDEDAVSMGLVQGLRNAHVDVVTTLEVDRRETTDLAQLIWASEQGRVIYSFNRRDFMRLQNDFLSQEKKHSGIIIAHQQRYSIGQQLRGLLKIISTIASEEMVNQIVFLNSYINSE